MHRILAAVILLALWLTSPAFGQATVAQTTNSSVVITTGNTFQTVLAAVTANSQRKSLTIQNNNASDACWITFGKIGSTVITFGNAAKATSIQLAAGQAYTRYYPYIPNDEIEATCATSSDTLYIDSQ